MSRRAESSSAETVRLLAPNGALVEGEGADRYGALIDALSESELQGMYAHMVRVRRLDEEATNLQRQGELALWAPSLGQEAAQVGAATATRPQDHIFPSYREHAIATVRGVDFVDVLRQFRGLAHGGWDPAETNFHLYTLVIGAHTLHATGYAMGLTLDGRTATGDPSRDAAVMVCFGDGATSQGDTNEAMVFAASYEAPVVFLLQNNQWAISVPVTRQSREPLFRRAEGFGIPSVRVDGNDVLASYAVSRASLESARAGGGPRYIEAVTYRMGAHTTSDDPTRYRMSSEEESWARRDPIARFARYLRGRGASESFFTEAAEAADAYASDVRSRVLTLAEPTARDMFDHVYSEPHATIDAQKAWLADYEASLGGAS